MFITIEGIDGCGKSTQAGNLTAMLQDAGKRVLWTREPGDWTQGKQIRSMLLEGQIEHPLTEAFLFLADRCEHVRQVIMPAVREGTIVVCERYNDSTIAYQCWGRGIDRARLQSIIDWCGLPKPDLTFWLDLPVETAIERRMGREAADRFESQKMSFHINVANGFKIIAEEEPERVCRIDSSHGRDDTCRAMRDELVRRGIL